MTPDRKTLLGCLRGLLRYHRDLGIAAYPRNSGCDTLLRWQAPTVGEALLEKAAGPTSVAGAKASKKEQASVGPPPPSLADIAREVAVCQACELHRQRLYAVPGRGPEKMRVFVVGDWLMAAPGEQLPPGQLFGVEQDVMLARMFSAIRLPPSEVFVTNAVKCALPAAGEVGERLVACCSSYLSRQLAAATPEVILAMGSVATRAVLGQSANFTRIRGKMQWRQEEGGRKVPVLATYHPSYLLQNSEMKKVAWGDLQLLARYLRLDR